MRRVWVYRMQVPNTEIFRFFKLSSERSNAKEQRAQGKKQDFALSVSMRCKIQRGHVL